MATKFSTSVNIIRDAKRELNYLVTSNSERSAAIIADNYKKGIHSFTIIGSYGTGKSSFVWALQQSLLGNIKNLPFKIKSNDGPVKILNFVGVYQSLIEHFSEHFEVKNDFKGNQRILDALYQEYEKVHKKDGLLVIAIDEFGKFLEYAVKHNPEKELYFVQQLSEFVNDQNRNIILITTLHQNFEAYSGSSLSEPQKQEWKKIKGRLKEITFNEPPEQLLIVASKRLGQRKTNNKVHDLAAKIQRKHNVFYVEPELINEVSGFLGPLDFFSAYIITLALQKYGQNERSLFTFLETEINHNRAFNISTVYDYLFNEYYSYLNSKNNLDYTNWAIIRDSIERTEAIIDERTDIAIEVVKIIGLLGLFSSKAASINTQFIDSYFSLIERNVKVEPILKKLKESRIIRFNNFSNSFKLYEGTDVNIESELLRAANDVSEEIDLVSKLKEYFDFPYISAKSVSYLKGTPRFFSFEVSDQLKYDKSQGELDGKIVLIFSNKINLAKVISHSSEDTEANLYAYFKNSSKIKDLILDIEKTRIVRKKNNDDKVAVKELNNILLAQRELLNHFVWDSFYTGDVVWVYNGQQKSITNRRKLNQCLSEICDTVYKKTPIFRNELINRHSISGAIHNARKNYFTSLVANFSESDLGFLKETFPPEKTIYNTLLKETKIHLLINKEWDFNEPPLHSNFYELWSISEEFLNSCQDEKRTLMDFFDILSDKPFKLKQGFLEFWIPTFLFIKRDDFALYGDQGYIPDINSSHLYLFTRNAKEFSIKAFNVRGVKLNLYNRYREFLNLKKEKQLSNKSFIESIKPFLVLYKQLPEYSRHTKRLSPETIAIRTAIQQSEDPEKVFFEDFPKALKTTMKELSSSKKALENYVNALQVVLRELRSSFDDLVDRIEMFLIQEGLGEKKLKFPEYKDKLIQQFSQLKEHQLLPKQRSFLMRITSPLDDKKTWLSSISHSILNKPLQQFKDEDEEFFKEKLIHLIVEMDNLSQIKNLKKEQGEEIIKLDITTSAGMTNQIIRLPGGKGNEAKSIESGIRKVLGKDKRVNIKALMDLLKDQLK